MINTIKNDKAEQRQKVRKNTLLDKMVKDMIFTSKGFSRQKKQQEQETLRVIDNTI